MVDESWRTASRLGDKHRHAGHLSALRGLLAATGWRVLLGVDFGHFEPVRAADEARYARKILGAHLLGIEIGNEPDAYGRKNDNLCPRTYSIGEYLREAEAYRQALGSIRPTVAVYGPALSLRRPWYRWELPRVCSPRSPSTHTQSNMPNYPRLLARSPPQLNCLRLRFAGRRMNPPDARSCPQHHGPSDADRGDKQRCLRRKDRCQSGIAGALWSLDWILRAESRDVRGLNFHGGLHPCRSYPESPICSLGDEETADAGDVTAQPEYYGLLAARQLEGGRFVPTRLVALTSLPNLTTWATLTTDGVIKIAIVNFATAAWPNPCLSPSPTIRPPRKR